MATVIAIGRRFPAPAGSLAAAFAALTADQLSTVAALAIDELDRREPEADVEANGDELDGCMSEEGFHDQSSNWIGHPGCPLSDEGGDEDEILTMLPKYGEDQSAGPVNGVGAMPQRQRELMA
jgi:hypothetical protein